MVVMVAVVAQSRHFVLILDKVCRARQSW